MPIELKDKWIERGLGAATAPTLQDEMQHLNREEQSTRRSCGARRVRGPACWVTTNSFDARHGGKDNAVTSLPGLDGQLRGDISLRRKSCSCFASRFLRDGTLMRRARGNSSSTK